MPKFLIQHSNGLDIEIDTKPGQGGRIVSNLKNGHCTRKEADVLESFLLALACAGVNVCNKKITTALFVTLEALANNA